MKFQYLTYELRVKKEINLVHIIKIKAVRNHISNFGKNIFEMLTIHSINEKSKGA